VATGTAWTILLAAAPTSSGGLKCTFSPVLHNLGRLAKPSAKRQTQEAVAGWPDLDRDFAEEPGLIPYPSAIPDRLQTCRTWPFYRPYSYKMGVLKFSTSW
jgi:hypothetical protein